MRRLVGQVTIGAFSTSEETPHHVEDPSLQPGWPSVLMYTRDGRLTIDNSPAEQAIRPLAVGRRNWLHIGGDGGLWSTAVLLSLAASVKRHGINPWAYLTHALTALPTRSPAAILADLLPDAWAKSGGETRGRAG